MDFSRNAQLSPLRRALSECLAGTGSVTMVNGPTGTGKTELVRVFAQHAEAAGACYLGAAAAASDRYVPLAVLRQILGAADLDAGQAEAVARLLAEWTFTTLLHGGKTPSETAQVPRGLGEIFGGLSVQRPLVIAVDDAHHMDPASLDCLVELIRGIEQLRVMVVLVENDSFRRPRLLTRLPERPRYREIRLGLLGPRGIVALLAAQPDLPRGCNPSVCYEITGGNLRLLSALVEDYRAAGTQTPAPVAGAAFASAALTCLLRSDPMLLPMARALAVVKEPVTPELLSELTGSDDDAAKWAIDAATEIGLLTGYRFLHKRARSAILDVTSLAERSDLHRRVARVLHRGDAPAAVIAPHVLAADYADEPWSAAVLRAAAEQALEVDDAGLALDYLRLAECGRADEAEQASIHALIAQVKWQQDPRSAEREIDALLRLARRGCASPRDALALVSYLGWLGRPGEAAEIFGWVSAAPGTVGADLLDNAGTRLGYTYPALLQAGSAPSGQSASDDGSPRPLGPVIRSVFADGFGQRAVDEAEAILQREVLSQPTADRLLTSLEMLVLADRLGPAEHWCGELLRRAETRRVPTWCAYLHGIRAMISFRQGLLLEAERGALEALAVVPPRGLGVFAGLPLSVLVLAATRLKRYDLAMRYLSVPVPDAMFQSMAGLHYLRARGRYYLARGSCQAAAEDFEACGDLMTAWKADWPEIAPWRSDLAEANLRTGASARDLVVEQLTRVGPGSNRTRGISLRVLAAASPVRERSVILWDAVVALRLSGDTLELASAMNDLSNATLESAPLEDSSGGPPASTFRSHPAGSELAFPVGEPDVQDTPLLSDAERKVALLAAQGYTNRQIAGRLYISASTVEQHLTRVYRKLNVRRRTDLPLSVRPGAGRPGFAQRNAGLRHPTPKPPNCGLGDRARHRPGAGGAASSYKGC
jgi:DNA-binding CsgD family transcriptional regulator